MINKYSMKIQSTLQLSPHFQVMEFASPDKADEVLIDTNLVDDFEMIRNYFGVPVYVDPGYRSPPCNKASGGAPDSDHLTGRAGDIDVGKGSNVIEPRLVAMAAEAFGIQRIGLYIYPDGRSWIHIGSYPLDLKWFDFAPGKRKYVDTFLPIMRRQYLVYTDRYEVRVIQTILAKKGLYTDKVDGKFGLNTWKAVKAFQLKMYIGSDGVVGAVTWEKLFTK